MKQLKAFLVLAISAMLASCGGGSDGSLIGPGGILDADVATIEIVASSRTLNSSADAETTIQIFATVLDSNRAVVVGAVVSFSADTGSIKGIQTITDDEGLAIGELNNGNNLTNRTIIVTVAAGEIEATIPINVEGTTLSIDCPPALTLNDSIDCQIKVQDFAGSNIETTVSLSSANGNTLSASTIDTDVNGPVTVTFTADNPGNDTVTATALGETDVAAITVSGDVFSIQEPLADDELELNTNHNIRVLWTKDSVPQAGEIITFTSTRGTIVGGNGDGTATTQANGQATIQVSSLSAGPATISVINDELTTTSVTVEFIADTPSILDLQANPLTVGVENQTTITASVFDVNGNAVKNKIVKFTIEQDSTGNSFLSAGLAVTDSEGRASTTYTAGSTPSPSNGVTIRATVQDPTAVTNTVNLTVAARAVDTAIGTGNTLFEPTTSLFAQEWAIIVTDTTGTAPEPVANTNVQASIRSVRYFKGQMELYDSDPTVGVDLDWAPVAMSADFTTTPVTPAVLGYKATCLDEDTNKDGFLNTDPLDPLFEDINNSGQMEAGNRATLTALPPGADADACSQITALGGPTTIVKTDDNGIARICVVYTQSDNLWVQARITSLLTVFGTEYQENRDFILPASGEKLDDEAIEPPGRRSPFGVEGDFDDPNDVPDAGLIPGCQNTF